MTEPYQREETNIGEQPKLSWEQINDSYALALVNQTFSRYETWRYNNHDQRWTVADSLYVGYVKQRYWEGTKTPRASLPVQITFDQIETALPIIVNSIFGNDEWFQVAPLPGASLDDARAQQQRLVYLLEQPRDAFGSSSRLEIDHAIKSVLQYGNGGCVLEPDPKTGDPAPSWVDIRDVYVDPGTNSPLIDRAKSVIWRKRLNVSQLEALRNQPGVKLPPKEALVAMAASAPQVSADTTKQIQESLRGVSTRPGWDDLAVNPADRPLEVLCYYSPTKIIWVLNRRWVAYNEANPWGFIPFVFAPCFIYLSAFYAMSFPDVLQANQEYLQGIRNGRLDELSLGLDPPRGRKRGTNLIPGQNRWRPGLVMEFGSDISQEFGLYPPQNITQNAYVEAAQLEADAEKRTGVNQMVTTGMPMRSNASRTAAGIQQQSYWPTARLQRIVQMVEDYLIVPMLYKLSIMDKVIQERKGGKVYGQSAQGVTELNPEALGKPVKFRILGASRMLTRDKLAQVFPFVSQFLLAGPFVSQLAKQGQTVDYNELFRLLQDATGTRVAYNLVRPMTQQEQQAMSQPSPELMARMQQEQIRAQTRLQAAQISVQGDLAKTQAEHQLRGDELGEKSAIELLKLALQSMENEKSRRHEREMSRETSERDRQVEHEGRMMDQAHDRQERAQDRQSEHVMHNQDLMAQLTEAALNREAQREQAKLRAKSTPKKKSV